MNSYLRFVNEPKNRALRYHAIWRISFGVRCIGDGLPDFSRRWSAVGKALRAHERRKEIFNIVGDLMFLLDTNTCIWFTAGF